MKLTGIRCVLVAASFELVLCASYSRAQDFDREAYYHAVEYCRGDVSRPMALSPDGLVLCFDGIVVADLDVSPARGLKESGFFVARSRGGIPNAAVALSNIIRDRRAMVVVYDHCLSACAMFFLMAPHQSYVLKGTLVAWHYPQSGDPNNPFCTYVIEPRDGKLRKLQRGSCESGGERGVKLSSEMERFFQERVIGHSFEYPPDSLYVRRMLRNLYGDTGVFRDVLWTLHPRYYPLLFKTKVFYEAYPQSQQEVDEMALRLQLGKVICDP